MKRWLPFPLLWALLVALWLLLNQTLAAGHVILGALVALGATHGFAVLQPPPTRLRHPAVMLQLATLVITDIVRSNIAVARIIMHAGVRDPSPGFLDIPLTLRHPAGLAVLACIITATPGTVWARYDSARGILTLHILDLVDEDAWICVIKDRYERRLLEIFE